MRSDDFCSPAATPMFGLSFLGFAPWFWTKRKKQNDHEENLRWVAGLQD